MRLRHLVRFYGESYRMVTPFASDHFGPMVLVEVGALAVGSVVQRFRPGVPVARGALKGSFDLGGSTVVLVFELGAIALDADLVDHTRREIETYLRRGESLGRSLRGDVMGATWMPWWRWVVGRRGWIAGLYSYLDHPEPRFLGATGRGTFVFVGLDPAEPRPDTLLPPLQARSGAVLAELHEEFPEATLRWTGEPVLNHDLRRSSADEVRAAEGRALPLTLALLLVAFGAVAASLLPLLVGALAIGLALGLAALLAGAWPLSSSLQTVVSMLGLGLGIDYALLVVSRFRESLASGRPPEEAAQEAAREAGGTVAVSALAVAVGFAGLRWCRSTSCGPLPWGGCWWSAPALSWPSPPFPAGSPGSAPGWTSSACGARRAEAKNPGSAGRAV